MLLARHHLWILQEWELVLVICFEGDWPFVITFLCNSYSWLARCLIHGHDGLSIGMNWHTMLCLLKQRLSVLVFRNFLDLFDILCVEWAITDVCIAVWHWFFRQDNLSLLDSVNRVYLVRSRLWSCLTSLDLIQLTSIDFCNGRIGLRSTKNVLWPLYLALLTLAIRAKSIHVDALLIWRVIERCILGWCLSCLDTSCSWLNCSSSSLA